MLNRYLLTIVILLLALSPARLLAQDPYIISGKIYDSVNSQALAAASIRVKGSSSGTVSKDDGSFQLKTTQKLPLTLIVTSIGFKAQEFTVREEGAHGINIALNTQNVLVDQVV